MIKYLAGIFDSEGHVRIRKTMSGKNYSYTYECKIEMTNFEIINLFAERYDLQIYEYNRPDSNNKTSYSIALNGKQLRETSFIKDLLPHLNEKYYQMDCVRRLISGENKEMCYQNYMIYKKTFNHGLVNKPDFEYLAGIIDGDGCLSMFNSINKKTGSFNKYSVSLEQRYRALVEYMSVTFGGSNVYLKKAKSDKHKETYSWQITTKDAVEILNGIEPYLVEKKSKCNILINYINEFEKFKEFSKQSLQMWY